MYAEKPAENKRMLTHTTIAQTINYSDTSILLWTTWTQQSQEEHKLMCSPSQTKYTKWFGNSVVSFPGFNFTCGARWTGLAITFLQWAVYPRCTLTPGCWWTPQPPALAGQWLSGPCNCTWRDQASECRVNTADPCRAREAIWLDRINLNPRLAYTDICRPHPKLALPHDWLLNLHTLKGRHEIHSN